jgi:uncharacterized protein (TIGR00730 family)
MSRGAHSTRPAGARYPELIMSPIHGNGLRRIGVFCGSSEGDRPEYRAEAVALGEAIAAAGLGLVYGGASCGLMGALADAALECGAEVIGVLPRILEGREIAHAGLTSLEIVATMHERKARMHHLSCALITLPGGHGTLDELMEAVTWAQLGLHHKPCILVNTLGYWNGLLAFLDSAVSSGFVRPNDRALLRVAGNSAEALELAATLAWAR